MADASVAQSVKGWLADVAVMRSISAGVEFFIITVNMFFLQFLNQTLSNVVIDEYF